VSLLRRGSSLLHRVSVGGTFEGSRDAGLAGGLERPGRRLRWTVCQETSTSCRESRLGAKRATARACDRIGNRVRRPAAGLELVPYGMAKLMVEKK